MVIKYHISPYPSYSGDLVVKIWEAASDGPGAEVYTETINAPHTSPATVTANGMDRVVHIVRLYTDTATLLHEYNVEPTADIVTVFDPIQFKVGDAGPDTPAADQDTCVTPELVGLEQSDFIINRNNYGMLIPDTHFSFDSGTGTWVLTAPDQFGDGEEFTIIRLPKAITTIVNDSVVGKWFAGFVDVSANTNYDNAHLRKLIRFSGSPEYTFQVSDTIPQGYVFCFQHFGASGTAKINFNNSTLLWAGSPKASLDIPRYSEGAFVFDGTNWNVVYFIDTSFANAPSTPPGTILKVGTQAQGDIPGGDPLILITHNAGIVGDYQPIFSFKNNNPADYGRNNKICFSWHHHPTDKANKIYLTPQEVNGEVQDVTICYILVKA